MAARVSKEWARKNMPSALAALKKSDPDRLAEIQSLKREIKKLLKRGESVYVEHSATGGKLV